jgi:hypothetical protein
MGIGKTIKSYILWTYDRGSFHYDVMVTIILLFIFIAPRVISFKDKPAERIPHQTEVVVSPDGQGGFFYQVNPSAVQSQPGLSVEDALLRVIEPVAGEIRLVDYKAVTDPSDPSGKIIYYRARVHRP